MMLNALLVMIISALAQMKKIASKVELPFTQKDKDKLDSITNPMLIKGTVTDMKALLTVTDAQPGWVFFVGDGESDFEEYVRTEAGTWEFIGSSEVDLTDYVKKTDYATATVAGVVKVSTSENTANGISMNSSGQLRIQAATNKEIDDETSNQRPIVPSNVTHMMSSYGIESKEQIPDMLARIEALETKLNS